MKSNLKFIILSERSQSELATHCMIPALWHREKAKLWRRRKDPWWLPRLGRAWTLSGVMRCHVPHMPLYISPDAWGMDNTKSDPWSEPWTSVIIMSQCRFILGLEKENVPFWWVMLITEEAGHAWELGIWEICALSPRFYFKAESAWKWGLKKLPITFDLSV